MKLLLYFHSLEECMMFDPTTDLWERRTLHLPLVDLRKLQQMKMVCTDKWWLFFVSPQWDEFICCHLENARTGRCILVPETLLCALTLIRCAQMYTVKSAPSSNWRLERSGSSNFRRDRSRTVEGSIIVNHHICTSNIPSFQFTLLERHRVGTPTVSLELQDSRSGITLTIPGVTREFHFVAFPTTTFHNPFGPVNEEIILLGFYRSQVKPGAYDLLVYDIQNQRERWLLGIGSRVLEARGPETRTIAFGTVNGVGALEFVGLSQAGGLLTTTFPPPITAIPRNHLIYEFLPDGTITEKYSETVNFFAVRQEHIEFVICLFRESGRGRVHISVLTINLQDGSQSISPWKEWRTSAWNSVASSRDLPSSDDFHILDY